MCSEVIQQQVRICLSVNNHNIIYLATVKRQQKYVDVYAVTVKAEYMILFFKLLLIDWSYKSNFSADKDERLLES